MDQLSAMLDLCRLTFCDVSTFSGSLTSLWTGFFSYRFSPEDAHLSFILLLRSTHFASYSQGAWYESYAATLVGLPTQPPLDFSVGTRDSRRHLSTSTSIDRSQRSQHSPPHPRSRASASGFLHHPERWRCIFVPSTRHPSRPRP